MRWGRTGRSRRPPRLGGANLPLRDPLNKERRFIPLRLDDAPIKGSLAQFLYINWRPAEREQEYAELLESSRPGLQGSARNRTIPSVL